MASKPHHTASLNDPPLVPVEVLFYLIDGVHVCLQDGVTHEDGDPLDGGRSPVHDSCARPDRVLLVKKTGAICSVFLTFTFRNEYEQNV